ncbi:MAG: FtsK/SpoIIIE domain-containing protein [Candidatus Dormibacteraeota bacterium]|nr:FtsK/SpoIIIE domain-containing protein [Candidatus Dormibacteraeota bacterium]
MRLADSGRQLLAMWRMPAALALVLVLAAAAVALVRYVLAGRETRRSMRQAWTVRWGWRRLSLMLGLTATDRLPRGLRALLELVGLVKPGKPTVVRARLKVKADHYGLIVRASTVPGVGREAWVNAAPHLADAWGCVRVAVTQSEPSWLTVRAVRRDPLLAPASYVPTGLAPAELDCWEIGQDEYAGPVEVRLSNVPGIAIAGVPGYGKTIVVIGLVARLAPSPAVQFAVVDGKGGADYEDLAGRFFAFVGDDLATASAVFRRMYELRQRRARMIRASLGTKNFWHVGPSERWPLVVLVIDEAHTFLSDANVKGNRQLAELVAENRRLVEDVVKKGRSVGLLVILATQKATGDAIPTAIRDVCPVAMSFAQRTDEAAVAALGGDIRDYPEANPVALQDPAYVGVASMVVQGRPGFTRVRTPYVRDEDARKVCADTARLTRDPLALLDGAGYAVQPTVITGGADPARGEDKSAGAFAQGLEVGSQVWTERVTPSPIRADVGGESA